MRLPAYCLAALLSWCLLYPPPFSMAAEEELPQWRDPVPFAEVNTSYIEKSPFLSFDGLTFYWARENGPGWHYSRLFQATRATVSEPFGAPEEISTLNNDAGHVTSPWVSPDNLRLYYYCTGYPGQQLRYSRRASTADSWLPGRNISELNQLGRLAEPTLTKDELTIVFSGRDLAGGAGSWDLWMATRPNREARFDAITNLATVNSEARDGHASLSADGLTLYFMSERQSHPQIYRAHRASLEDSFGSVTHLADLDVPHANTAFPSIAPDQKTFYFAVYPDDSDGDIYVCRAGRTFYVDGAAGSDTADGWTPETAFATIQHAIEAARDGDIVNVCPGTYQEEIDFLGKAITVQGSGDAATLEAPEGFAVSFARNEGEDSVLRNFVITNSWIAVFIRGASPTITHVTVVSNEYGIEAYRDAAPTISNSIFWGNAVSNLYGCTASYTCVQKGIQGVGGPWPADWVTVPSWPGEIEFRIWPWSGIDADPLFVDPNNGDYHLRSERGRFWPEHKVWVLDAVTSPCIDAGDPTTDLSREPVPNGGRVNMGAYGGTAFASMSESPFRTDFNGDRAVDANDLELFTEVWEQEIEATAPRRRR